MSYTEDYLNELSKLTIEDKIAKALSLCKTIMQDIYKHGVENYQHVSCNRRGECIDHRESADYSVTGHWCTVCIGANLEPWTGPTDELNDIINNKLIDCEKVIKEFYYEK